MQDKEVIVFGRCFRLSFLLVALVTLSSATAWAELCSQATLIGTYVAFEQGQFITAIPGLFPLGPFVNIAKGFFDGAGNVSGRYVAVIGDGTVRTGTFSGTYKVGAGCAYSDDFLVTIPGVSFPVPLHHKGFIAGQSMLQEVHYVYADPSGHEVGVISGTLKKQ
jgi:hypothetical protein